MRIEMSQTIEEKNKALVFQDEVTVWNNLAKPGTQATIAK